MFLTISNRRVGKKIPNSLCCYGYGEYAVEKLKNYIFCLLKNVYFSYFGVGPINIILGRLICGCHSRIGGVRNWKQDNKRDFFFRNTNADDDECQKNHYNDGLFAKVLHGTYKRVFEANIFKGLFFPFLSLNHYA